MPKKVKNREKPTAAKQVKFTENTNLYQLAPKWSFVKCDIHHEKWGILTNSNYLGKMIERFKEWERVKWSDVLTPTAGRKHNTQSHPIPIFKLDSAAQKRIVELNLDSYDVLYSLAITGKQRVWGIMDEGTGMFQLLWYDPNHEVYPLSN